MRKIIIAPQQLKNKILKSISEDKKLLDVKITNFNEIKKKMYFDFDTRTLYELSKKYNLKYDVALVYINNLYNLVNIDDAKVNKLKELKDFLDLNNLLIYDDCFIDYIKDCDIEVIGYYKLNKEQLKIIDELRKYASVTIKEESFKLEHQIINEFNNKEEEISFVAENIGALIKNGIDINKIKLANVPNDYNFLIKRIFNYYNIPVEINNKMLLINTNIVRFFLDNLENNANIVLKKIEDVFDLNDKRNSIIYNKIIDILNDCSWSNNYLEIKSLLEYIFKNESVKLSSLINKIEVIDINEIDNNYIFLMSFNQGIIPNIHKDELYFSDFFRKSNNIDTSNELNKIERENTLFYLSKCSNLNISYKIKDEAKDMYITSLVDFMDYEVKRQSFSISKFSNKYNEFILARSLDNLFKYGTVSKNIEILNSNYSLSYRCYDNKFSHIDKKLLNNFLGGKLKLSYSSMNDYYKCKFKYYLANILKLNKSKETFDTELGNLLHLCLSKAFDEKFSIEQMFFDNISSNIYNARELYFLNNLKEELKFIIETIKEQNKYSMLKESLYEHKIYVNKYENIQVIFNGIIDKLVYNSDLKILSIIDYKTGNPDINLNNNIYGLDMQLPIYLYLIKNSEFKDYSIAGFYLQKILNKEVNIDTKKTYIEQKKDNLKLVGYSNSSIDILDKFDDSYESSFLIKSMTTTSKGFGVYSKVLSDFQMDSLVSLVDKKINEAVSGITNGDFDINPKKINEKNKSCEFCEFKDICYMREKDLINLEEYKNLDFLGGDANA